MNSEREGQLLDLVRANQMLLSGRSREKMDAVYLHGLSEGMVASGNLFNLVADEFHEGRTKFVAFNGSNGEGPGEIKTPGESWPGRAWYTKELDRRGIPVENMAPTGPGYHTRSETDELVRMAKEYGWKKVGIVTVAYHYPRSFLCLVMSMETIGYWFQAYPLPPTSTDWQLPMMGSQSEEKTTSFRESIVESRKVIDSYIAKGFGCTFAELFSYLERRSSI